MRLTICEMLNTNFITNAIDITNKTQNFQNTSGSVAAYDSAYRCGSRRCEICLTEKYVIAKTNHKNLLNKRTEIISKCRYRNKYILKISKNS